MKKTVCLLLALVISLSCCVIVTAEKAGTAAITDSSADNASFLSKLWRKVKIFTEGKWDTVSSYLKSLWGKTENFTEEKWNTVSSYLKVLWEKLVGFFGNTTGSLSDIFGKARGSVSELLAGISDYVHGLTGQLAALFA